MRKFLIPFKTLSSTERKYATFIVFVTFFGLWELSGHAFIPSPIDVLEAFPKLVAKNSLVENFLKSLIFCLRTIVMATIISYTIMMMSIIPAFTVFCSFLRKFRFLPSTGLSLLFIKMTPDIENQMVWMMVYGISTWLIDSLLAISLSITPDEISYAKSLRLNRWQMVREILIKGKAANVFKAVTSNFAIAWMLLASVENISKASGGIGVTLAESNKYFKLEEVYAIQFLILFTGIGVDYFLTQIRIWLMPYSKL